MAETFKVITSDYVNVRISTSREQSNFNEKRFQKGIKVLDLKVTLLVWLTILFFLKNPLLLEQIRTSNRRKSIYNGT